MIQSLPPLAAARLFFPPAGICRVPGWQVLFSRLFRSRSRLPYSTSYLATSSVPTEFSGVVSWPKLGTSTRSGKKLWNSYFKLTSQIYPCLFRLMGSYPCTRCGKKLWNS
ncbi:hypothetical protein L873DRAFT_446004 [Choiromyces venosus 120613-1]|uniref:Uncharacterized protein n=1 Tax=Choiromyces venosus 120613-1 TaxID=1336337 RepID=A0A3N4JVA4_9PEZI|nr:hypothetical protein L873DRAFT_446004 [Choiromyces venosus 120613-1]